MPYSPMTTSEPIAQIGTVVYECPRCGEADPSLCECQPSGPCEDAPCCGCCGPQGDDQPEYGAFAAGEFYDDGRWDDDPSPYDGTYSEC